MTVAGDATDRPTIPEPTRPDQVVSTLFIAFVLTAAAWFRADERRSPAMMAILFVGIAVLMVLLVARVRRRWAQANGITHQEGAPQRRPWSEVPSRQKTRVWIMFGSVGLLWLMLAPLITFGIVSRGDVAGALPLAAVLLVMTAAAAYVWRDVRRPSAVTKQVEKVAQRTSAKKLLGGPALGYLLVLPASVALAWVYDALEQNQALALVVTFLAAAVVGALMTWAETRYRRRYPAGQDPEPSQPW